MTAVVTIRSLRAADITVLGGVLARAYESEQNFELRLEAYLQMRAVATFVADLDGKPVGMVVGNDYGPVAYVSQMAVEPALQRRGIGTALMAGLTAWADERRFAAIELDATPSGAPLYARFGFLKAGQTSVYHAVARGGDVRAARPYAAADREALFAADSRGFGADRRDVLRLLIDSAHNAVVVTGPPGAVDGYAVAQPRAELLGPVVASSAAGAARLIDAARTYLPARHRMSVPSDNRMARAIVAASGYRLSRSLAHMIRGTRPRAARQTLFARINLGQG